MSLSTFNPVHHPGSMPMSGSAHSQVGGSLPSSMPPSMPSSVPSAPAEDSPASSSGISSSPAKRLDPTSMKPDYTISACIHCRKRKRKCDNGLPSCSGCAKLDLHCEFFDPKLNEPVPRAHICQLENKLRALLEEKKRRPHAKAGEPRTSTEKRVETLISEKVGLVSVNANTYSEKLFLGHSSGFQLAQLLLEKVQGKQSQLDAPRHVSQLPTQQHHLDALQLAQLPSVPRSAMLSISALAAPAPSAPPLSASLHSSPSVPQSPHVSQSPSSLAPPVSMMPSPQQFSTSPGSAPSAIPPSPDADQPKQSLSLPPLSSFLYLVTLYVEQSEVRYPIFLRASLMELIANVYHNIDRDAHSLCAINLIMAISLQISARSDLRLIPLAGEYYQEALRYLKQTCYHTKDLRTLQCLLLTIIYSLLNPSRVPVWHLAGLAVRMCLDLGLHREEVINSTPGLDPLQADLRRRLWWSTYAVDRGLSLAIGRPLTIPDDTITTHYPSDLEDACIENGQRIPQVNLSKAVTNHWLDLRRLQSEVVGKLYVNSSDEISSDDPWFAETTRRFNYWRDHSPQGAHAGPLNEDWSLHGYYNGIMLMNRPSPACPSPPPKSYVICYESAAANLVLYRKMLDAKSLDVTWLICHYLFVCGITLIYTYYYSKEVRDLYSVDDLINSSNLCSMCLRDITPRWPAASGMLKGFELLASVPVKAFSQPAPPQEQEPIEEGQQTRQQTPGLPTHNGNGMAPPAPNGGSAVGTPFMDQRMPDDSDLLDANFLGPEIAGMSEQEILEQIFLDYRYPNEMDMFSGVFPT